MNSRTTQKPFLSLEILAALVFYYAIVIPYWGYVPLWDSLENLEEYLFLPRQQLTFDNLLLMHNGHPSLGYFWPFWIGQWLFPSQMLMVHIINLLIGSLAIISFGKVVGLAFEGLICRTERALITIAFAVQPVFVAYAVNMSPDYGILAYFLATLWCLYSGRFGWAAWTGVSLIFSKEIGVPSYLLLIIFFLGGGGRRYAWKEIWPLAIPFLVFGLYCFYERYNQRPIFPWAVGWIGHRTLWDMYCPNPWKIDFRMACLGPLIFEFQWIFAIVIVAGLLYGVIVARKDNGMGIDFRLWLRGINLPFRSFLFLLIGVLYIDSRVVVFTNPRYFIVLYPLILLTFLAALVQLNLRKFVRTTVLTSSIALLLGCNFWTLDPISREIAKTFRFGDHDLLSVATILPDFGDLNRDEMVYNLQHTQISYLLDEAFEEIRPTDQTIFVLPADAWWMMARLDARTFHRTETHTPPFIQPILTSPQKLKKKADKPPIIFWIELPNFDNPKQFAVLNPFYQLKQRYVVCKDGYQLQVSEMILKTSGSPVANGGK